MKKLKHGGDLARAEAEFGVPAADWLDLSTGISPWCWPVPELPESVWRTLPGDGAGLKTAAAEYYGLSTEAVLPVPGSQLAIQTIPTLFEPAAVAIPRWGYGEHRLGWQRAGHHIVHYRNAAELCQLVAAGQVQHVVVINPNNPSAERFSTEDLLGLQRQLKHKDGWLVVDEAFIDSSPEHSLASHCPLPGLVVLRSPGKFFGLAGLRLGFAIAPAALLTQLAQLLPPWIVSHPALWVGERALADCQWQQQQRERLAQASSQWLQQLRQALPTLDWVATPLFVSGSGDDNYCQQIYQQLGQQGILVRIFDAVDGVNRLRFGIPANKAEGQRALNALSEEVSA
ncbi:threonine-phosphate decarboxylase CobD [Porticoccus sp. W117]|uniref:threonine-phosphate decarboxylase CobD n=1 Tax=Porticoccus sp. W117 TaxID=3054777 RepID=UPI002596922C|nr:threonine-phosphate decarboxylase CobD [Porticoccus sp. W117]MDM3871411.1 threonine-phosphate decarboxylase CobD [Porticoccus sp. W117]